MVAVSIVIITKNAADILPGCIEKSKEITDDIIIVENGVQTGNTVWAGCKLIAANWNGYGNTKNAGIAAAKYDWILSIDSDEVPDDALIRSLHGLDYSNPATVYDIKFRSHVGERVIRFGSWGRDHHIRLFNRMLVKWTGNIVHETLVLPQNVILKKISTGYLNHYSAKDICEYRDKAKHYATLSAKEYFSNGKKTNWVKLYLSPAFGFLRSYIFYFGFLDGRAGLEIACLVFKNTGFKYQLLNQMEKTRASRKVTDHTLLIDYRQKIST